MIDDIEITPFMREQLEAKSASSGGKTHLFLTGNTDLEEWTKLGKPFIWLVAEKDKNIVVLTEVSYGRLAAFEDGKLIGIGKNSVISDSFVVMDRGYYGTVKYIWF